MSVIDFSETKHKTTKNLPNLWKNDVLIKKYEKKGKVLNF